MFFNLKKHFKKDQHKTSHTTSITSESGRTMTEMLGVLAVIGVLSIGGIAGYSYAMDKYRANVTINDINLRAVDLITQALDDKPLSLSNWNATSMAGYTFGNFGETDDGMIFLEISGIPKGVCNMVVETLGEQFDMDINGERIDETDECGLSDSNVITVYFEGSGAGVTCTPSCKEDQVCDGGICMDKGSVIGTGTELIGCTVDSDCPECLGCSADGICGNNPTALNGSACMNGAGTCLNGACQANLCSSGEPCGSGFFCADRNSSCASRTPNQCSSLNGYFVRKTITLSDNTIETWYVSKRTVSWWDAESACTAAGLTMATVSDLMSGWNGSTGTFTRTDRAQKLYNAIGTSYTYVWTSDIHSNSCNAFDVDLSYGSVYSNSRSRYSYDGFLALCR